MSGRFALVIGNERYADPLLNSGLHAPKEDVEALAKLLENPQIGGFQVTSLIDRTFVEVRSALAEFLEGKKRDDTILIYFSGHGIKDSFSNVYLAVKDTEKEKPWALGIDSDFLRRTQERCQSQRQVLILDCCYSGAWAKGTKGPDAGTVDAKEAFLGSGFGQVVITATNAVQLAVEADQLIQDSKYSLFTHYLVEGLRTGQADGCPLGPPDGLISEFELYEYAYQKIDQSKIQTPQRVARHQGLPIVIARNPLFEAMSDEFKQLVRTLNDRDSRRDQRASAATALGEYLTSGDSEIATMAKRSLETAQANDSSPMVKKAATDALRTLAVSLGPAPVEKEKRDSALNNGVANTKVPLIEEVPKPSPQWMQALKAASLLAMFFGEGWLAEVVSGIGASLAASSAWNLTAYLGFGLALGLICGVTLGMIAKASRRVTQFLLFLSWGLGWAVASHFETQGAFVGSLASAVALTGINLYRKLGSRALRG